MRETNFIKQKKDKWIELERTIQRNDPDPDKLNDLFVQITDDLSYSRTFYPNRSVRVYLNGLAQQIFYSIYKNKKSSGGRFMSFWTEDLPRLMYQCRWELLLATLLFWVSFIVGCLSGYLGVDEEFARQLLGDEYIDMTISNISSGDPMAIYKDENKFTMFLTIYLNNLLVCFRYFMFGVLFTIGSVIELVYFGLYVGAFQFFFHEQDELVSSVLGIWTHGSLEIPAAILAGTAGIVMGKGLVFPGTYSRLQAFLLSARKGIKIMIGTIPLIFLAAFIESYITRLTDAPDLLRIVFIVFNFFLVLFYFVILPFMLSTVNFNKHLPIIGTISLGLTIALYALLLVLGIEGGYVFALISLPVFFFAIMQAYLVMGKFQEKPLLEEDEKLQAAKRAEVKFDKIKSGGEIFKDVFVIYKDNLPRIIWTAFGSATFFITVVLLLADGTPSELFEYPARFANITNVLMNDILNYTIFAGVVKFLFETFFDVMKTASQFFDYKLGFISPYFMVNMIIYTMISYVSLAGVKDAYNKSIQTFETKNGWAQKMADIAKIALVVLLLNLQLLWGHSHGFFYFTFFLTFPFFVLWSAVMVLEGGNVAKSLGRTFQLLFTRIGNMFVLYIILGITCIMIWSLFFSPVMMFVLENFGYNISTNQEGMDELIAVAVTYMAQVMFGIITPLSIIGIGLYYYSQVEIRDAKSLFNKIQQIGTRKRIRGLEREG